MKVFYTAKNFAGKVKAEELDVRNERDLAAQLRAEGYALTSFEELKSAADGKNKIKLLDRFISISLTDKLMFTRNLSVMISSGLPLSKAIRNIAAQTKKKSFAAILNQICEGIQAGGTFADGLARYPGIFDELFVNMVRVGETSGGLEEVLDILAVQLEKEHALLSKIKGAMTYPAVIVVAMIGIAILMLTYILPTLMGVFTDMNVQLPASTRFLVFLSDSLRHHGVLIALGTIIMLICVKLFLMTKPGKRTIGFLALNVPIVKNIVIKVNCSRFARIYSSLLKSGVSAVESLEIISRTLTNYYYRQAIENGVANIQKGIPLSDIVAKYPRIFPVLTIQMLQVGEETGKTEMVLLKLAEFYEEEVDQLSKNMSSVIEPIIMVVIGSAVGFFAISIIQPIYSIMDQIK